MEKKKKTKNTDVKIDGAGGFYAFSALTKNAQDWFEKNIQLESWQWIDENSFACDDGYYARELAHKMVEDNLIVR